jgi:hypothetical protein
MGDWTVHVAGDVVQEAIAAGYSASYADGATAIAVGYCAKLEACRRAEQFGRVLSLSK